MQIARTQLDLIIVPVTQDTVVMDSIVQVKLVSEDSHWSVIFQDDKMDLERLNEVLIHNSLRY